jgi:hypothetical protein
MKTMVALARHRRLWVCGWFAACSMIASQVGAQSVVPRIASKILNSDQVTLTGSRPPIAQAEFDTGRVPSATKLTGISLFFSRSEEQKADLQTLIAQQQDPNSSLYHQWLTPDEFAARFGMADADLNKVKSWLQKQGFSIDSVARSRNMIRFSGTVNQVEQAFSTEMHSYKIESETHFAPATELSIPSALASVVLGIRNLDDFRPRPMHVITAQPNYTSSQSAAVHFAPGDIRVAYNIPSSYTGAGQSIAIMGQSAIVLSDIEHFQSASGLTVKDPTVVLVPGTGSSTIYTGDEGESDLDLEWSGGIATGANIVFVYTGNSINSNGVFDSYQYTVDQNLAPIISFSYGSCETFFTTSSIAPYEAVGEQAVAQGQTVIVSSGDSGATSCYGFTTLSATEQKAIVVSYPASSAYVTALGGTEITAANDVVGTYWGAATSSSVDKITSALSYIPEVAWNDDSSTNGLSSSGGGASALIAKPTWQTGITGIPADSKRDVPDVSLYSSPSYPGYLYCSSDSNTNISGSCTNGFRDKNSQYLTIAGGTSFAAPIFAGMVALINQAKNYTEGQGMINDQLYTLASNSATYASAFYDTTSGNNNCTAGSTYCSSTTGFSAGTGYDLVTGLGSVNLGNLIEAWPANSSTTATLIPTSTTVSASSSAPAVNATDTFTITVVASSGSTTPSGNLTISIDGSTAATVALAASSTAGTATATYQTSFATTGTHQIIAQFPQSATFASSSGVAQVTVSSTTTTTTTLATSSATPASGTSVTLTATVSPSAATGTVTFYDGTTTLGTGTLSSGIATYTTSTLATGAHTITASYAGNSTYTASTSSSVTVTVGSSSTLTATTTTLATSSATPTSGTSVTLTATVSPTAATGTVTFYDGTTTLGTGTLSSGIATYTTSTLATGTHTITASYAGNSTYAASTSSSVTVTVSSSSAGTSGSTTVTITPAGGYTGTVTFSASTSSTTLSNSTSVCYTISDAAVTNTAAVTQTLTFEAAAKCATSSSRKGAANIRLGNASTLNKSASNPAIPVTRAAFGFLGLIFAGLLGRRSRKLRILASFMVLVALGFTLSGCGGGSGTTTSKSFSLSASPSTVTISAGSSGAPTGTYGLTLTGTDSSSSSITSSTTVTLVID